jgi:phage terminase small subunit
MRSRRVIPVSLSPNPKLNSMSTQGKRGAAKKKPATPKPKAQPETPPPPADGLTLKQRTFKVEYLANGFNATAAAKTAGYSDKTAAAQGSRLLKNVKVAAAIAASVGRSLTKREITSDRVLDEIAKVGFRDNRRFFTETGQLIPIHLLGDEEAASLAGIEVDVITGLGGDEDDDDGFVTRTTKIKMADKLKALELLGKYLKLFTDKVDHSVSLKLEDLVLGGNDEEKKS